MFLFKEQRMDSRIQFMSGFIFEFPVVQSSQPPNSKSKLISEQWTFLLGTKKLVERDVMSEEKTNFFYFEDQLKFYILENWLAKV